MEVKQTEFHDDLGLMRRIDYWLFCAGLAKREMDYFNWFLNLCNVFDELRPLTKSDERNLLRNMIRVLWEYINTQINSGVASSGGVEMDPKLWWALDTLSEQLSDIHKSCGLRLKEKDDYLEPESTY